MPFSDLHEFIQGQFAAFAGHDEYETQLTAWGHLQRSAAAERAREWRRANATYVRAYDAARRPSRARRAAIARAERYRAWVLANPERARASKRMRQAKWRAKRPVDACGRCSRLRVAGRTSCEIHLEYDRKKAARRYAAKLAA